MKITNRLIILLFLALSAFLASCSSWNKTSKDSKDDVRPVTVFENEYAKVVEITLQPGEQQAEHEGGERLVYSLSDYTIDWLEKGQNKSTQTWNKGDIHVHTAGVHSARNIGSSTAHWILFTRKTNLLPSCEEQSLETDVNLVSSSHANRLYDDERFRVTEVTLEPGEAIQMHDGINRIIYSLSDYTIYYTSNTEGTSENSFTKGDVHWHAGCRHALENSGNTVANYLVISYK
jgi:quercetin dioxygenase-like cupin family protein